MALYIQDRFTIEQDGLTLSDALILPVEEYNSLTSQQISTLKQERFAAYKERATHPIPVPEPPVLEVLAAIDQQIADLTAQKKSLQNQVKEDNVENIDKLGT